MGRFQQLKANTKRLFLLWRIVVIVVLSAAFIPLFLKSIGNTAFYTTLVSASFIGYLIILAIMFGMHQGKPKKYMEATSTRLLIAFVLLTVAFLATRFESLDAARALLVGSALAYAFFLQKLSFLRVIFL